MPNGAVEGVGVLRPVEPLVPSLLASGDGGAPVSSQRGACQRPQRGSAARPPADGVTTACRPRVHHPTSIVFDPTRH
jgi:hypothetical protein